MKHATLGEITCPACGCEFVTLLKPDLTEMVVRAQCGNPNCEKSTGYFNSQIEALTAFKNGEWELTRQSFGLRP